MGKHWCDKRAAVALVGSELSRRGWRLCGWTADASDSMTDYYAPEHWDGVATHLERPGVVVCVYVNEYTVKSSSGGVSKARQIQGEPCPRCAGLQADPEEWTLTSARENPSGWHASKHAGTNAVSLFPSVVSPIPFLGSGWGAGIAETYDYPPEMRGRERCRTCSGRGHMLRSEAYVEPWPTFQANPPHATWHVERDGRIIAQGTGVFSVEDKWDRGDRPKLRAIVDRIERAADGATEETEAETPGQALADGGAILRPGKRPGYVELTFPGKPAEDVRAELKGAGYRWAKGSGCWYGLASRLPARYGQAPEAEQGHAPDIDIAAGY